MLPRRKPNPIFSQVFMTDRLPSRPRLLIEEWLPITEFRHREPSRTHADDPFPAPTGCTSGGLVDRWLPAGLRFWPVFFRLMRIMPRFLHMLGIHGNPMTRR